MHYFSRESRTIVCTHQIRTMDQIRSTSIAETILSTKFCFHVQQPIEEQEGHFPISKPTGEDGPPTATCYHTKVKMYDTLPRSKQNHKLMGPQYHFSMSPGECHAHKSETLAYLYILNTMSMIWTVDANTVKGPNWKLCSQMCNA